MKPIVFIDGDQGTTGLQIHARLAGRDDLTLLTLPPAERKSPGLRADAINSADVAILCLPDDAARAAVASLRNPRVRVIDASSAHRTDPRWTYGFPEMVAGQGARIATADRITNPGCYPTGAIALLKPLVAAGALPSATPLVIHAVSGYSGRGRAGVEQYEGQAGAGGPGLQLYALGLEHKHVPEIVRHAGLEARPIFLPAYGAFRQGIVLTIGLHRQQLAAGWSGERVSACLAEHYRDAVRVRVLPAGRTEPAPTLAADALAGTDDLALSVFDHPVHGHLVLAAVFDNLGKGAAGAAVQNLDLLLH